MATRPIIDTATRETASFARQWAKQWSSPRVLEIGCGLGELAEAMQAQGCRVTALDPSEQAIEATRARGVTAQRATWPDFDGGPYELVLFTRSLHHISPLEPAVARAHAVLVDGGALLVEDFAFDEVGEWTARWFHGLVQMLDASGIALDPETFAGEVLKSGQGLEVWLHDHGHDLHSAAAMRQAIESTFGNIEVTDTPYLYRYVRQAVDAERYRDAIEAVWSLESTVGREREGFLMGRRMTAEKR